MNITLNGNKTDFDNISTISELLENLDLAVDSVVVELNTKIIQPDSYGATQLGEGDGVEIIRFVGGG
ncbi:MAG: sulfur carrier protein ThiS [Desulfocapsa sp.]|nr:sulfur carrier protein ThiS [Desulfocapsa sp.]